MNANIRSFAIAVVTALTIAGAGASHGHARAPAAADDDPGLWFIELNGAIDTFRAETQAAGKLQVVVTKALAEEGNPSHIETWTSPTIVVTRQ